MSPVQTTKNITSSNTSSATRRAEPWKPPPSGLKNLSQENQKKLIASLKRCQLQTASPNTGALQTLIEREEQKKERTTAAKSKNVSPNALVASPFPQQKLLVGGKTSLKIQKAAAMVNLRNDFESVKPFQHHMSSVLLKVAAPTGISHRTNNGANSTAHRKVFPAKSSVIAAAA